MDKYIIVKTLCNNKEIANEIIKKVLKEKLAAGCQIYNCESKYYWNKQIEQSKEYLIEMRTKLSRFKKIENIIKNIHDYEVCEVSCIEILDANPEFLNWIEESICS